MFKNCQLNPQTTGVMIYLISGVLISFFCSWTIPIFLFAAFNFIWFGLASSLYYHRTLSHRAIEMTLPTEIFFLLGGLFGLGGDPIRWVAIHRYHHRNSDRPNDAHSPNTGLWYSYYGWVIRMDEKLVKPLRDHFCEDLNNRPLLRICRGPIMEGAPHLLFASFICWKWGLDAVVLAIILPVVLTISFHWCLIASLCHSSA